MNAFKEMNASPSCIAVTSDQLNDGSGIAATLRLHNAKYHKTWRTYCSSSRNKWLCPKQEQTEISPKKLRSEETSTANVKHCIICNSDNQENLRTVTTENFDSNLKCWAKKANTLF